MIVAEIKLFELLKAKIGEKEAEAFVELLENKVDNKFLEKSQVYKDDIRALSEHIDKTFATKEDLANVKGELKTEIANTKVELIKWLVTIAIALGGLIIAAAKFIR